MKKLLNYYLNNVSRETNKGEIIKYENLFLLYKWKRF